MGKEDTMNHKNHSPRTDPSVPHKGYSLLPLSIPLWTLDWFTSVWHISPVHPLERYALTPGHEKQGHPAPFPEELVRRLVLIYSQPGDLVLDPFCGSGTTNFVALKLRRKTIGYDVEQEFIDIAKRRCEGKGAFYAKSSEKMDELADSSVDLVITSPPYLHARRYSDQPENIGNIPDPFPALRRVFLEVHRVLKQWRYFCLNVSSLTEHGYVSPFPFHVLLMCLQMGFRLRTTIIWWKGAHYTEWGLRNRQVTEGHEYIWVLRKVRGETA